MEAKITMTGVAVANANVAILALSNGHTGMEQAV